MRWSHTFEACRRHGAHQDMALAIADTIHLEHQGEIVGKVRGPGVGMESSKRERVLELLRSGIKLSSTIAKRVGCSEQWVNRIRMDEKSRN